MTLDKAVALIATHLGIVDEQQIDNMSFLFFEDVLEQLGKKLTYDAIVNYAGNSFCEKSWDMIMENNPIASSNSGNNNGKKLLDGLSISNIKIAKPGTVRKETKDNGKQD